MWANERFGGKHNLHVDGDAEMFQGPWATRIQLCLWKGKSRKVIRELSGKAGQWWEKVGDLYFLLRFNTKRPSQVLMTLSKDDVSDVMGGGWSHSSTYGCQKSGPFPRDSTVYVHARSLAIAMLRRRKKRIIVVTWPPIRRTAASSGCVNVNVKMKHCMALAQVWTLNGIWKPNMVFVERPVIFGELEEHQKK